jgi:hypothetical protein
VTGYSIKAELKASPQRTLNEKLIYLAPQKTIGNCGKLMLREEITGFEYIELFVWLGRLTIPY